jgi:hypothetical protein|tara:strand:+ start:6407 stop:7834 length:1428 start_codon:yes stop_codon:yes gene_type:complete
MSKRLSALTKITSILDGALIYIVDLTRTAGDQSVGITKQNLANDLGQATGEPVSYSAIWSTGLTFLVSAETYYINNNIHTATAANVTLDAAHASLDRLDYLGAFADGTVGKVTGTPATTSLVTEPEYDPSDFFPIKLVLINTGDTTPTDPDTGETADTTLIFDEDTGSPTEWDLTLNSGDLAVTTVDPYSGTKSIEATNSNLNDLMTFTWTSLKSTDDITALSWWTKLKADMSANSIRLSFHNGNELVGKVTYFNDGRNGFDSSNLSYQKITINRDDFIGLPSAQYDSIKISYFTQTFAGYFFDKFELHEGSTALPPTSGGNFGDVFGANVSIDDSIAVFSGTTGKIIKDSGIKITDLTETLAFSDETTSLTTGTSKLTFAMPNYATTLTGVSVNVKTAPTGSTLIFDLNEGGTSVLSTKVSIDIGEVNSETSATPPVISDSAIAANAVMSIDIDQVGSTIAGVGGKFRLYYKKA